MKISLVNLFTAYRHIITSPSFCTSLVLFISWGYFRIIFSYLYFSHFYFHFSRCRTQSVRWTVEKKPMVKRYN